MLIGGHVDVDVPLESVVVRIVDWIGDIHYMTSILICSLQPRLEYGGATIFLEDSLQFFCRMDIRIVAQRGYQMRHLLVSA